MALKLVGRYTEKNAFTRSGGFIRGDAQPAVPSSGYGLGHGDLIYGKVVLNMPNDRVVLFRGRQGFWEFPEARRFCLLFDCNRKPTKKNQQFAGDKIHE